MKTINYQQLEAHLHCLLLLGYLCLCNACSESNLLKTKAEQQQFLEAIYDLDQFVRNEETRLLEAHGYESKIYKDHLSIMMDTDSQNLKHIERYLSQYGYPTKKDHGGKAASTPWLVIHHAWGDVDIRRRNFKHLYKAWKEGNIDGGAFTFYLNRMYKVEKGQRLQIKSPFTEAFEVDTLIQAMDLTALKMEVDKRLKMQLTHSK